MFNRLTLIGRALLNYRRIGIGMLRHSSGGLLRYEIEERAAKQSNDFVSNAFQIQLGDASLPRDDLLHFMVFARNAHFFFLRPHFTRWVVLMARLTNVGGRVDPSNPSPMVSRLITVQMCLQIGGRIVASAIRYRKPKPSVIDIAEPTDGATVAVVHYLGISPDRRNDLFWLSEHTASKVGKVVLLVGSARDKLAAIRQRDAFLQASSQKGLSVPRILILPLDAAVTPKLSATIRSSRDLDINTANTTFLDRFLMRACYIYYARFRDKYAYFLETTGASAVASANPSFVNAAISGAALQTSSLSIFRELSVWGNWSEVYRNKVICDCLSSLSATSKTYLEETNPHVKTVLTHESSRHQSTALANDKVSTDDTVFRVLFLGSNIGKNITFKAPQVIPENLAMSEIGTFCQWAIGQDNLSVRVKEKKEGSGILSIRSIVHEHTDAINDTTFGSWEQTAGLTPHQFAEEIDLAIAIGTFYPSSLHELSNTLPKDRCLFWDLAGLTSRYPSIGDVAPISIARNLKEVKAHILSLRTSPKPTEPQKRANGSGSFEAWLLEVLENPPAKPQ